MVTKWDLVTDAERTSLEATPFGHPCSACQTPLDTEADFAKHFNLIRKPGLYGEDTPQRDRWYLNLGTCPEKKESE